MDLNKDTLILFEEERSSYSFFPPDKSDSFYNIGESRIDLYYDEISKFDINCIDGTLHVGDGTFEVSPSMYKSISISKDSYFIIDKSIIIDNATVDIYGKIELIESSNIIIRNGGKLNIHPDANLIINESASIQIDETSSMSMYGSGSIDINYINEFLNMDRIYIDSSAFIIAININLGDREFSITDYDTLLRSKTIIDKTIGEYNVPNGRIGYICKSADFDNNSRYLELNLLYGEAVLGDYKLSVLGKQENTISNLQIIQSFHILEDTCLYISESYKGYTYIRPELYLGVIIDNIDKTASCLVDGTIIVDGENACITIDRKSTLTISETGSIYLRNGSKIKCTNNDSDIVLKVNGKLIIDTIDQISMFLGENIEFGENGKLIVLNPYTEDTILFSTPDGKYDTDLYRILEDKLDHVEYHMSAHTGIKIDKFFEYFNKELTDWYAGMRIEKAVHEGLIVWEDEAFIELDSSIIPWVNQDTTLLEASRIFKSFLSTDKEKIIDVAKRLKYAGFGNIRIKFVYGNNSKELIFHLEDSKMEFITATSNDDEYNINVSEDGELFLKNKISEIDDKNILDDDAKVIHVSKGDNLFIL